MGYTSDRRNKFYPEPKYDEPCTKCQYLLKFGFRKDGSD